MCWGQNKGRLCTARSSTPDSPTRPCAGYKPCSTRRWRRPQRGRPDPPQPRHANKPKARQEKMEPLDASQATALLEVARRDRVSMPSTPCASYAGSGRARHSRFAGRTWTSNGWHSG